jgi:hypothetical protein
MALPISPLLHKEGTKSSVLLMGTGLAVFAAVAVIAFAMKDEAIATRVRIWL